MTAVTAGNTTSCWSLKEALADPEHEEHEDQLDWRYVRLYTLIVCWT